jgi:hypothetical protein
MSCFHWTIVIALITVLIIAIPSIISRNMAEIVHCEVYEEKTISFNVQNKLVKCGMDLCPFNKAFLCSENVHTFFGNLVNSGIGSKNEVVMEGFGLYQTPSWNYTGEWKNNVFHNDGTFCLRVGDRVFEFFSSWSGGILTVSFITQKLFYTHSFTNIFLIFARVARQFLFETLTAKSLYN